MADRSELARAVDLALAGDWNGAHEIAQQDEDDELACWLHAVLHKIEGDAGNARYWYRRTSHTYDEHPSTAAELAAIKAALAAS